MLRTLPEQGGRAFIRRIGIRDFVGRMKQVAPEEMEQEGVTQLAGLLVYCPSHDIAAPLAYSSLGFVFVKWADPFN